MSGGSGLRLLLGAALPLSDHLAVNNDLSCAAAPEDDEEGNEEADDTAYDDTNNDTSCGLSSSVDCIGSIIVVGGVV